MNIMSLFKKRKDSLTLMTHYIQRMQYAKGGTAMSVKKKIEKRVKKTVKAGKKTSRLVALTAVAMVAYPIAMTLVNADDD